MLTASSDTGAKFIGTAKNDLFKADSFVSATGNYLPTLNLSDELDGGAGKDTLNITSDDDSKAYKMADATIKNIETITIKGAHNVTADVSGSNITGLETISVLKSDNADVTAAATTDVNVSGATGATIDVDGGKNVVVSDATADNDITIGATTAAAGTITVTDTKQGTGDIAVDGGTDVTVTATAAEDGTLTTTGAIDIGQAADLPTGDIKVTQNLEFDGNDAGAAGGTADLTGGDITISGGKTVDVTVNANNVATVDTAANDIVVGTITVKGGDNTTTVTVTQNDNTETFTSAKVAEVKDTQTITFKALTAGQHVSITGGGAPAKILTFTASKDLTAEEVAAAFAGLVADDRQDNGGKVANGVYNGQFAANWSAKSVSGATVTFEAPQANPTTLADNTSSVVPTFGTPVNGTIASGGVESTNTVVYGQVVINNTAKTGATDAIKTVTVDGYAAASSINSNALTDVTLKNSSGTMTVNSTVASLNLTVDNVNDTVDLDGTVPATTLKTLNLTTTGEEESAFGLDANAVETLTIAAGADLDISNGSTKLGALKTATITGAGNVDLGDLSGSASFATLTASAATGDITVEIDSTVTAVTTGSGNDEVTATVANATTAISKAIDLGAGDDTLVLFANTTAIPTAAVAGGTGTDTISMTSVSADAFDINTNFAAAISGFEKLEISDTFLNAAVTQETLILDMEKLGFNYVITNGTGTATAQDRISLTNLAANATVELNANGLVIAALKTATGTTDVMNVVTNVTTSSVDFGTFTVASVEIVNITANDTQLDDNSDDVIDSNDIVEVATLNLTADAAKTVNVTGTSSLTLDTNPGVASSVLTKVDANAMTGDLVYTADGAAAGTEVIGGAGNDTLTASGENDVLKGGEGSDTLTATDLTTVYGGAGADKFYFATPTLLSNVSTIADLGSGDTIYLIDNENGNALVTKFFAAGAQYNVNTTTGVDAKVKASLVQTGEGQATWFQNGGNTYIVIDNDDASNLAAGNITDSYNVGKDVVIEITGLVDLSTASFNKTTGTLEIA